MPYNPLSRLGQQPLRMAAPKPAAPQDTIAAQLAEWPACPAEVRAAAKALAKKLPALAPAWGASHTNFLKQLVSQPGRPPACLSATKNAYTAHRRLSPLRCPSAASPVRRWARTCGWRWWRWST